MSEPIQILRASAPRRVVAFAMQAVLGVMLIWIAIVHPPEDPLWLLFLVALGIVVLMLARKGWLGSRGAIVLDAGGLRGADGIPIAPLAEIASVDRALFSFKPSNGFVVRLREPAARAWAPGMWWRVGRRVGIGGVTGGAQTKLLADTLSMMVAERNRETR